MVIIEFFIFSKIKIVQQKSELYCLCYYLCFIVYAMFSASSQLSRDGFLVIA